MSLVIGENFSYQGQKPNFVRDTFATLEEMKNFPETSIDDGHISLCSETKLRYEFYSTNTVDTTTGKWRRIIDTKPDANSENPLSNKALSQEFKTIESNTDKKILDATIELNKKIDGITDQKPVNSEAFNELKQEFENSTEVASAAINELKSTKLDSGISINGHKLYNGNINIDKSDIGLGKVDNTSDIEKPISTLQQAAINKKVDSKEGHCLIDEGSLTKLKDLPDKTTLDDHLNNIESSINNHINDVTSNPHKITATTVGLNQWFGKNPSTLEVSEPQQLALDTKVDKSTKINEKELSGNITLNKIDLGLSQVDNTSDADKPISIAQQEKFDELEQILYNQHSFVDIFSNISGNLIELGVPMEVTLNWKYVFNGKEQNPEVLKLQKNKIDLVTDPNTKSVTETISEKTIYKVISENKKVQKTKELTINAVNPKYFGGSTLESLSGVEFQNYFQKQKISSQAKGNYSFDVGVDEYVWLCIPIGMTISKVTSSGFEVPMNSPEEVTISKGVYKCYRSAETFQSGNFVCEIEN